MIYLTSDIHGKTRALMQLLEKARFFESSDNFLYILGDVIDRNGDGGVGLLKWLLTQPNCQLICGNHEIMLLRNEWLLSEITPDAIAELNDKQFRDFLLWQNNGGDITLAALAKQPPDARADIFTYLNDAPLYEWVSVGEQKYLLVHAGLGGFSPERTIESYLPEELTWTRPSLDTEYSNDFITVFGHTPTLLYGSEHSGRCFKTKTWWNIDTGAAGGLNPMLICLDDLTEYYID